jgi:5-methylthioadenosine/S-adenosylhomocysteine deaminase
MLAKYGQSPVQTLAAWGVFDGPTIAAHVIWVDPADIRTLAEKKVGLAHCPSSNMKLASGIAPVVAQQAAGLKVGLGTDGPAGSNNDFQLLEELDLAAKLQKVSRMDPEVLSAKKALAMATIDGAHVIGQADRLGSLEAGKQADLVFLNTATLHSTPSFDPYSTVVYAAKSADVTDVFVAGRRLVANRQLTTLNPLTLRSKAEDFRRQIVLSLQKK